MGERHVERARQRLEACRSTPISAPFSILDSMPADSPAWSASSAPVKSSLRRRLRTCVPIASAMDRLAAVCGASDPVFSPSPAERGPGLFDLELGLRAGPSLAMDRFVLFRPHLYHQADQHFPFAASKSTMISPQETRHLTTFATPPPADEADWRLLWSGYCKFYETEVPEAVTAATWVRMIAVGSPLFGRIAEWDGQVAGFAISVLHEG